MDDTPDGTTQALVAVARAIQQLAASTNRIADALDKTERATTPRAPAGLAGKPATSEPSRPPPPVTEAGDQYRWPFPNHGLRVEDC
jgi:hypothetical protein